MGPTDEDQPETCDRCGGAARRAATRRDQLVRWFIHGEGAGSAWYCRDCGASWSGGSTYGVLYPKTAWHRRARLPLDVLQAVRAARHWHPVPMFYAAVAGVALVPAVATAVFTRARWWVSLVAVPVAAVAGTFLWSLASAAGRGRRDVLWQLAPERAWRRDLEEELAGIRAQAADLHLLVPDGWTGELSLDGASWSIPPRGPRVLQEATVVADQGDPLLDPGREAPGWRPPSPRVEIHLTRDSWGPMEARAVNEFLERALPGSPPDLRGVEQADRQELERRLLAAHRDEEQARQRWAAELAHRWRDGTMLVNGVETGARLLTHDDADVQVATFVHDDRPCMVIATGIDLDTLSLVGVDDPAPLIDAFEVRRRRMFAAPSG